MAISTLCPGCQTLLRLPDELAGKQVRCQTCSRLMMVPGVLSAPPKAPSKSARSEPAPVSARPTPPLTPNPPAPSMAPPAAPRVAPQMPSSPAAPPGDGLPAVVLVEVPVKPVPPPMPEAAAPSPAKAEPPPRRPGPTMTLGRGERGRRTTNRPRRPTSVLAGLSLGGMLLLFVLLIGASFVTWVVTEIQANQGAQGRFNNNNFVQIQPNQPPQPGPVFPPQFKGQPPIFLPPQANANEPLSGAQGSMQTFEPGPRGPRLAQVDGRFDLQNNKRIVHQDMLGPNDQRDPVQRWQFAQTLPCKVYEVKLQKGKRYTIDYQRGGFDQNFDPYLRIETENGERLVEEDDVGAINFQNNHDMNSRIDIHPSKTATYRIICTVYQHALQGGARPFTLTIREQPIVMPKVNLNVAVPKPRSLPTALTVTKITEKGIQASVVSRPNLRPVGDVCWSADGRSFFLLDSNGLLTRYSLDGFAEERRLEIGRQPGSMAMSGQGLVVTLPGNAQRAGADGEVWLIDPDTLQVRERFGVPLRPAPASTTLATAPGLDFAYVAATVFKSTNYPATHGVAILSLNNKEPVRFYDLPNAALAVSPDGSSLFAVSTARNHDTLLRYEIDRDTGDVQWKETGHPYQRTAAQHRRINISPDGKYVCVTGGVGVPPALLRQDPKLRPTNVVVYPLDNLRKPAFYLDSEILVQAVGFDPAHADGVFAHGRDLPLTVHDRDGHRKAGFRLKEVGTDQAPQQFLVHRDGGKMLIRFPASLCYAPIVNEKAPVVNRPNWPVPFTVNDGESLAAAPFKRGDVAYRELQLPNLGDIDPCWDAEGKSLFHLETDGTLTRLSTPDFVPRERLLLGQPAAAMALSSQGLLVALRDQAEVWIVNPQSLKVERAIACPAGPAKSLAAHPRQSIAAAVGTEVVLLDLKAGRVTARGLQPHPDAKLAFHSPMLSPDGRYVFLAHAGGGESKVLRVRVGNELTIEDSKQTAVKGLHAFCVTADGQHVAWYTPNVAGKAATAFYPVNDWKAPTFTLADRARMIAPAGATAVYVQTTNFDVRYLAEAANRDTKPAPVPWLAGRFRIRTLAVEPNRPTAFVASTGTQVYFGERAVK